MSDDGSSGGIQCGTTRYLPPQFSLIDCRFTCGVGDDATDKYNVSSIPPFEFSLASLSSVSETWNPGIVFADITDVGMRRANNQDSLACLPSKSAERFHARGHLFVVADGMGAHAAGELASRMATQRISQHYFKTPLTEAGEALRESVSEANCEIHRRGQQNPEFHNMGTTASSLVLTPAGAVIAHVGDSRIYRLRGETFEQMTFDHSLVWEMEASGQVHANSPLRHSIPKNVITRSLGPNAEVAIDVEGPFPVQAGDTFVMCSDGLTGQVDDQEIGAIVGSLPPDLATRVLVDLANLRGGPDNTTIIIVRVENAEHFLDLPPSRRASGIFSRAIFERVAPLLVAVAIGCFLIAGGFAFTAAWGQMIVAVVLGLIATVTGIVQYRNSESRRGRLPSMPAAGGQAPYRRYCAVATPDLHRKLSDTVEALRGASKSKQWNMDWTKIEKLRIEGREALEKQQTKVAIRHEAEAIIETMRQLREQRSRSTDESAIDY